MSDIREYVAMSEKIANGSHDFQDVKQEFVNRISAELTVEEHAKLVIDMLCSLGVRDEVRYLEIIWTAAMQDGTPAL